MLQRGSYQQVVAATESSLNNVLVAVKLLPLPSKLVHRSTKHIHTLDLRRYGEDGCWVSGQAPYLIQDVSLQHIGQVEPGGQLLREG